MATQDVIPKNVWNSGKLQLTFASKKLSNEENILEAKVSIDCKDENAFKQIRQNKQNKHISQEKEKNSIVSKSLDNQSNKFINKIHKKNSNRKSYDGFPRNNNNNNNYNNKPPNTKFSFLISNQDEMICHERVATAIQLQRVLRVNPIEELYCVYITSDRYALIFDLHVSNDFTTIYLYNSPRLYFI